MKKKRIFPIILVLTFLATLVALHSTPVSRWVVVLNQRSFQACELVCELLIYKSGTITLIHVFFDFTIHSLQCRESCLLSKTHKVTHPFDFKTNLGQGKQGEIIQHNLLRIFTFYFEKYSASFLRGMLFVEQDTHTARQFDFKTNPGQGKQSEIIHDSDFTFQFETYSVFVFTKDAVC